MAKTILITGASSGLGAGMAHEFAAKGLRRVDKALYNGSKQHCVRHRYLLNMLRTLSQTMVTVKIK